MYSFNFHLFKNLLVPLLMLKGRFHHCTSFPHVFPGGLSTWMISIKGVPPSDFVGSAWVLVDDALLCVDPTTGIWKGGEPGL